jgi:arabinosaccharide transport system permease protein
MASSKALPSVLMMLLFIILGLLAVFPFYCLLLASFKPATGLLTYGLQLKLQPELLSMKNYLYLFQEGKIYFQWYKNSILITVLFTILSLLLSSMVGYGLAVYRFKGRTLIFVLVLIVLMIPVEIIMLPLYQLIIKIRLIDTYWGIILPFVVSPVAVFFFRQYATGISKDYLDAGRMDGCNEFGIFFRIIVPLMAPAFGAMAILQALQSWNNFLWPLIVLRTDTMFTLPIGLSSMLTPFGSNYTMLISGSILSVVPIIVLFVFFQRYFISGLTVGGIKG